MGSIKPKKPKDIPLSEIERLHGREVRGTNPIINTHAGSSTTTFGPDGQPTITTSLSPELQGLFDMQTGFLQGGPQQVQPFSHSGMDALFSSFIDRMNQRNGSNVSAQLSPQGAKPLPGFGFTPPPTPGEVYTRPPSQGIPVNPGNGGGDGSGIGGGHAGDPYNPPTHPKSAQVNGLTPELLRLFGGG